MKSLNKKNYKKIVEETKSIKIMKIILVGKTIKKVEIKKNKHVKIISNKTNIN
jgi:hypothetical protein